MNGVKLGIWSVMLKEKAMRLKSNKIRKAINVFIEWKLYNRGQKGRKRPGNNLSPEKTYKQYVWR